MDFKNISQLWQEFLLEQEKPFGKKFFVDRDGEAKEPEYSELGDYSPEDFSQLFNKYWSDYTQQSSKSSKTEVLPFLKVIYKLYQEKHPLIREYLQELTPPSGLKVYRGRSKMSLAKAKGLIDPNKPLEPKKAYVYRSPDLYYTPRAGDFTSWSLKESIAEEFSEISTAYANPELYFVEEPVINMIMVASSDEPGFLFNPDAVSSQHIRERELIYVSPKPLKIFETLYVYVPPEENVDISDKGVAADILNQMIGENK